jgi:hypothetical protein
MTRTMEGIRLVGMVVTAAGAWYRSLGIVMVGVAVALFAWLRGVLIRD